MSEAEKQMQISEWQVLQGLCQEKVDILPVGNRKTRMQNLRDKCSARAQALFEGRVMP